MSTLYANFLAGQISDDPLSDSATTINSAGFASLPVVVSPDIMWITLDPDGDDGAPEIVKVTAHSESATSVTVQRAQQGTAARSHADETVWNHSWTKSDAEGSIGLIELLSPAGTLRASLTSAAETGWLAMGQTVSNAQTLYPTLWGKAPAGWKSGSSLVLPSMDDVSLAGAGGGGVLGALFGSNTSTLTSNNLPSHTHTMPGHTHTTPAHTHTGSTGSAGSHTHSYDKPTFFQNVNAGQGFSIVTDQPASTGNTGSAGAHTHTVTIDSGGSGTTGSGGSGNTGSTGSGTAFSTLNRNLAIIWKIKAH